MFPLTAHMNNVVMDNNKGPNVNVAEWLCNGNMQKDNDLKCKAEGPQRLIQNDRTIVCTEVYSSGHQRCSWSFPSETFSQVSSPIKI